MHAAACGLADFLLLPLELLLTCGGDRRTQMDPASGQSQYGCYASPRADVISLASSTASTISQRGYAAAEAARHALRSRSDQVGLDRAAEASALLIDDQVRVLLQIDDKVELVFSPSGTDSQLHAYVLARMLSGRPLVSVVAAADETGSGVMDAVSGRHFNSLSPCGAIVPKGAPLRGLEDSPACLPVPCRDSCGNVLSPAQLDAEVFEAVSRAVSQAGAAVLYAMDHSKLGSRCPSMECLEAIRTQWGSSVHVVVDACQARLSRARIKSYLNKDFLVVLTGSKFFAGPAFSGTLLVPAALSSRLSGLRAVPRELQLYAWRGHWPLRWHGIRSKLGQAANIGALLRWAAAIAEMQTYFNVPAAFRMKAMREFSEVVPQLIDSHPGLELLPEKRAAFPDQVDDEEMSLRTIFSFLVRSGNGYADVEVCRKAYADLTADPIILRRQSASRLDAELIRRPCHIGQPVAITLPSSHVAGALRISIDAKSVYQAWTCDGDSEPARALTVQFDNIARVLKKLALIMPATS